MKGQTTIPEDFSISDSMRAWACREVPGIDIDRETGRFVDHWLSNGRMKSNWTAAWRNWMRKAPEMGGYMKPREFVVPKAATNAPIQLREHPLFKGFKQN